MQLIRIDVLPHCNRIVLDPIEVIEYDAASRRGAISFIKSRKDIPVELRAKLVRIVEAL